MPATRLALVAASTVICISALCPLGVDALICNPGAYFDGAKCTLCPGGTFGGRPGLTAPRCSGVCAGGYFCPEGSTSARQNVCGRSIYFCPPGAAMRRLVGDAYYTIVSPSDRSNQPSPKNAASEQLMCEPGYFCRMGIRYPCPEGSYGEAYGLLTSECTGACPKGFFCPLATPHPLACPPGTFGNTLGLSNSRCSGLCPRGYYCESGTVVPQPCPTGTLGANLGLTTAACSAYCTPVGANSVCAPSLCPPGFFCPLASADPTPCGGVDAFCPAGSMAPTAVSGGFYTTWTPSDGAAALDDPYVAGNALAAVNQTKRSAQKRCEKGAYCVGGIKRLCPAGVYGDNDGLTTPACTAPCPAGYFCPIGTADYLQHPCASEALFCRQGSAEPAPASTGFFTIQSAAPESLRVDQAACPLGSYCVGGVANLCPIGTYGGSTGLSTSQCSGQCQDGYICPPGSTTATQSPCPAGSYSQNGINCSPCAPGYWCAAGSASPKQNECGSDTSYCPLGSSSPMSVLDGYFAVGQQVTTHTSQALCVVRNAKHLPQCPTRTVGINSGL